MAATPAQIVDYLLDITNAQSEYGREVAEHCRLGRNNIEVEKIKLAIVMYCVKALEKYFDGYDYENNNFFTKAEAKDIMERLNSICKTFIYLDI